MGRGISSVCLLSLVLLIPVRGADPDVVSRILYGVEDRYNHARTLQVGFIETLTAQGRKHTPERGELFLRKPGRMRWQYTVPAGRLFISDNKFIYSYVPSEKRAEKMKAKMSDDMHAPLAFLLGELHFHDDFREFRSHTEGADVYITAIPKSDNLPYSEVTFKVSPDFVIHYLKVTGQDGSLTEYVFEGEKRNPPIEDSLFRPPPGVEFVDSSPQ